MELLSLGTSCSRGRLCAAADAAPAIGAHGGIISLQGVHEARHATGCGQRGMGYDFSATGGGGRVAAWPE
jgi:hypothetical protein